LWYDFVIRIVGYINEWVARSQGRNGKAEVNRLMNWKDTRIEPLWTLKACVDKV
jgi:hypothetical protein